MRPASLSLPAVAAVLGAALLAVTTMAQAPQAGRPPASGGEQHHHGPAPKPTNLKVLPKTLTGDQVMDIMHGWEAQLGSECDTCHTADPVKKMPNGHPVLNFADDSKKEKETARLMLKMTMEINQNYTSMVESSHDNAEAAKKITCGTCHRGHLDPPAYVPPKGHEHHNGPAPAGAQPPVTH